MKPSARPPFAYVFERFPSFTQTFCAREVRELERLGVAPLLFSIHDTTGDVLRENLGRWADKVITLPQGADLVAEVSRMKTNGLLSQQAVLTLRHWGDKPDKRRVYEAIWISRCLQGTGVRHVHSHFAGIGARTCWWLRRFHGVTYSFTGHANDIFCDDPFEVSREKLMNDASVVITVSDFTRDYLREHYPKARVRRVYNGLDLAPVSEAVAGAGPPADPPRILSVGRLIEKKGFADLIAACAVLRDRDIPFQCKIIGEGPLESDLRARIAAARLDGRITLAGPLPFPEIARRLATSSVFALACVVESDGGMDNLPTVIMEAMAACLPCVSTRLAGVPEMVAHGETGLLAEPGDVPALADALASLLQSPEKRRAFGKAGLERVRRLFAKEVTARELRRELIAGGLVHPRFSWLRDDRRLAPAIAAQVIRRAALALRLGTPKPRRFPASP